MQTTLNVNIERPTPKCILKNMNILRDLKVHFWTLLQTLSKNVGEMLGQHQRTFQSNMYNF